jgi:hypothetical protein
MISLDEDYLGYTNNTVIIRGVKVCGGLVCEFSNNRVGGAHFTPGTSCSEILTAVTGLHRRAGGTVTSMYFVYNMSAWSGRGDKYASPTTLASDLKTMMGYTGKLKVFDKNIIALSVDIKLVQATGAISYRQTPNPDPATATAVGTVWRVKTAYGSKTPTIKNLDQVHNHRVQNNVGGFTAFQQILFAQV